MFAFNKFLCESGWKKLLLKFLFNYLISLLNKISNTLKITIPKWFYKCLIETLKNI